MKPRLDAQSGDHGLSREITKISLIRQALQVADHVGVALGSRFNVALKGQWVAGGLVQVLTNQIVLTETRKDEPDGARGDLKRQGLFLTLCWLDLEARKENGRH
jgi:hypothetical protein